MLGGSSLLLTTPSFIEICCFPFFFSTDERPFSRPPASES